MNATIKCRHCSQMLLVENASHLPPIYRACPTNPIWSHVLVFHSGCEQAWLSVFGVEADAIVQTFGLIGTVFTDPDDELKRARASWLASNRAATIDTLTAEFAAALENMSPRHFADDPVLAPYFKQLRLSDDE